MYAEGIWGFEMFKMLLNFSNINFQKFYLYSILSKNLTLHLKIYIVEGKNKFKKCLGKSLNQANEHNQWLLSQEWDENTKLMFKGSLHFVRIGHKFGAYLSSKAGNLINYMGHCSQDKTSHSEDSCFWY